MDGPRPGTGTSRRRGQEGTAGEEGHGAAFQAVGPGLSGRPYPPEEYHRQKRVLEDRLASLAVPGVDAAQEAGQLLEDLYSLWGQANFGERRRLLLTMLDAIYVDTIEEKCIVAIRPKPAFIPLFEVATTREGSDVVLLHEKDLPPADEGSEAASPCLWWRPGGSRTPYEPPTHSSAGGELVQS